eukprot:CAMPEP_0206224886 /NCGR_PEP_ID=MMETSP0047_2-20121206/7261_1 /ASSEMBLY_ACC=CAM_ASM_000192 /TAXON_ID=195065 /ORGANISM="Chroomonas mesostigmatica_cf, Strain CCMP1168" /LENGTH=32 /DNA_ID= /DNA_START= /DNA_END= /DNA_ORIENTATION=
MAGGRAQLSVVLNWPHQKGAEPAGAAAGTAML